MKVLAVLPPEPGPTARLERALEGIRTAWPGATLDLAAPPGAQHAHQRALPGRSVGLYLLGAPAPGYEAVVHVRFHDGPDPPAPRGVPTYVADGRGPPRARPPDPELDHVFLRAGTREDRYTFFPHVGFLYARRETGATNELGFRVPFDLARLEERPPDHRVVAVFGGSAVWGTFMEARDAFPARLEERLNRTCEARGLATRFTVLNFGLPGAVAFQEMACYLAFLHRLRPEVVIAHDGFNDLLLGQVTDPLLLHRYDLTYWHTLEAWAQNLHRTHDVPLTWTAGEPPSRTNYPRAIVGAYAARVRQFHDVVRAHGGDFLAGFQPAWFSKSFHSAAELRWHERHQLMAEIWEHVFPNLPYLYQQYLARVGNERAYPFLDLHAAFGRLGADQDLFEDYVHTTAAGHEVLADLYHERIAAQFLSPREPAAEVPA